MSEKNLKTSHLLFDESPLLLRPQLAVRIGDREALLLQQIHYWLENKRKSTKVKDYDDERTYNEGRFWTYNSYKEWQEQFPFWTVRMIERLFTRLEKMGILITGNFNRLKMDRTKWYTIDYDVLDTYNGPKVKKVKKKKVEEVKEENKDEKVEKTEESKKSDEAENVDLMQSAKNAECIETQSALLAECIETQSALLADCNPPFWQDATRTFGRLQSAILWSPLPKNTTETSPETSSQDFFNSSSLIDEKINNIVEEPNDKNEEEEYQVNRSLMYLGYELAQSGIMRTNAQIQEILKGTVDRKLLPFLDVDVANAINHYKAECVKRGKIGVPVEFFLNGFEMKLNQRFSGSVGANERKRKLESLSEQLSNSDVPFYNWLEA